MLPAMRIPVELGVLVLASLLTACACPPRRCCPPCPPTAMVTPRPTPTHPEEAALYDGRTGRPISLATFLGRAAGADFVAFGELHDHPVGARYELQVLEGLARSGRPLALAMEFFEADQQSDLDLYLAGKLDEPTFRKKTQRSKTYPKTHGPLVEFAKAHGIPVLSANAPRRLVSEYRKFEGTYDEYLASLAPQERAWLPDHTSTPKDAYHDRFLKLMGKERGEPYFRAQSLWDDAMGGRIAAYRDTHPDTRVLLVVGAFHVEGDLGTLTKFRERRPNDRTALLVMQMEDDPALPFTEEDRGAGDAVLVVRPPEMPATAGPNPHVRPHPKVPAPTPDAPAVGARAPKA